MKVPLCAPSDTSGKALSYTGTDCSCTNACSNKTTPCDEETLSKAREICMMPHGADPAETFLMDILADDSGSAQRHSTMSISFFLPEELFDLWNTVFTIWLRRSVAEEVESLAADCAPVEVGTDTPGTDSFLSSKKSLSPFLRNAESFLAALLQGWLFTEKAHLRFTRDYAILKRDHFRCQVPGCNCRRNLHIHHIIWRSKGGSDEPSNLIVLCARHHLYILHNLLTLKIEGTAPHNLTFTFGPRSHGDGRPFLKYIKGRKVLTDKTVQCYDTADRA
ncbi:MAG: HNH endonuclease [Vulcanimicrobiota bacterium]